MGKKMANFEVLLAALLSPDNTTRSQAEVSQGRTKRSRAYM